MEKREIEAKLQLLIREFETALYDDDDIFLKNMETKSLAGDDISRYRHWEWPQGIGLFGYFKYYEVTKDENVLNSIRKYYRRQFELGFPARNINTTAPLLTLTYLYEKDGEEAYIQLCKEWAKWLVKDLPRTKENGFQHMTSDTKNDEELWDDTLFMAVLFLARMGKLTNNKSWIEEAEYQFLLHIKYLADNETGLWYHGWTFRGNHNFVKALWGRGNCWITMAIPIMIEILGDSMSESVKHYLISTLNRQISGLEAVQSENGMWHTLLDDPTSYVEASATCGFGYGISKAVRMGIADKEKLACVKKAIPPILDCITPEGTVRNVSYGTAMGRETKQFYKDIEIKSMPYGQATAILFLLEAMQTTI